jgi:hypothetical protein
MNTTTYAVWRWDRIGASVRESRGPERVDTSSPDPDFRARPVGFTADLTDPPPAPKHRRDVEPMAEPRSR